MDKKASILTDWKLHLAVLVSTVIAELIGTVKIPLGIFSFSLAPLIWSMILMTVLYLIPKQRIITEKSVSVAAEMMAITGGVLIAKLSVSAGASIEEVLAASIPVTLQNLGEGLSSFIGIPLALALGMNREAIGMTFGVSREANVSLISDKYGATSPEFRGVMVNYITGTVFGVITVSILMSILIATGAFNPISLALASGIGSASMMVGGLGTIIDAYPEQAQSLEAYAAASNVVSSVIAIYVALFMGLPLAERLYSFFDRVRFNKNKK